MKLVLTMKKIYHSVENSFEKFSGYVLSVLGNSITFIIALVLVVYWLLNKSFFEEPWRDQVRDVILSVTFISFFIIQKTFNHFSKAMHIKLNELVSAHDNASNNIVNVEQKSEIELKEIAKDYANIAEEKKENEAE